MRFWSVLAIMAMLASGLISEVQACSHGAVNENPTSADASDLHGHQQHSTKNIVAAHGDHHNAPSPDTDARHGSCADGCDGGMGCDGCVVFSALNMRALKYQAPLPSMFIYGLVHDIGRAPALFSDPPPPRI